MNLYKVGETHEKSYGKKTDLSRTTGFVLFGTFNEAERLGFCVETSMSESSTSLLSDKFRAG